MTSRRFFLVLAFVIICINPSVSLAKNKEADQQCKAGGVVGQPCKDNTNGYTTSGHCTHIMVCAADSWPKAPRGCQPGMVAGRDCPYGKNAPEFNTGPPVGPAATGTFDSHTGAINNDTLFNAFSGDSSDDTSSSSSTHASVVGSASIAGIEYLITGDSEALPVGEPLSPEPPPAQNVPMAIGTSYTLRPPTPTSQNVTQISVDQQGLRSSASFATDWHRDSENTAYSLSGGFFSILRSLTNTFTGFHATSSIDDGAYNVPRESFFAAIVSVLRSLLGM